MRKREKRNLLLTTLHSSPLVERYPLMPGNVIFQVTHDMLVVTTSHSTWQNMQLRRPNNLKITESRLIFNFKYYNHLYLLLLIFRQAACLCSQPPLFLCHLKLDTFQF